MNKLEALYEAIEKLKESGLTLNSNLIEQVEQKEEEIINEEVLPAITEVLEPIMEKIQRNLILEVTYHPDESLNIDLALGESIHYLENDKPKPAKKKKKYTLKKHTKKPKTILRVSFPDGTSFEERYAYKTLVKAIEKIGVERVEKLNIMARGENILQDKPNKQYNTHEVGNKYFLMTHSSTVEKKKQLSRISDELDLNLDISIIQ